MTDPTGAIVLGILVTLLIVLGAWAGSASFQRDTFECTNACGGKHSIRFEKDCYCKVEAS